MARTRPLMSFGSGQILVIRNRNQMVNRSTASPAYTFWVKLWPKDPALLLRRKMRIHKCGERP